MRTFDIGSMMMIPKNKQVSKIFQKKSAILAKDRSNIIRKPQQLSSDSNKFDYSENISSSHGLNDKGTIQQLNNDLGKNHEGKKKFKKASFF